MTKSTLTATDILAAHRNAGKTFTAGLPAIDRIPGKHFPQEDQAPAIAAHVAAIATRQAQEDPNCRA